MKKKTILKAKQIHKTFDYPVKTSILKGVDLEVSQGETVAIMGRSGEGKSTLLHILGTLDQPNQGSLVIAGKDANLFNKTLIRNESIGFIFQSFHLLEDYTVLENVMMPAKIGRKPFAAAKERALELLEHVGLLERASFNAKQLSGGEKQRVAIARALCNDPDIIFADEPSGNLDRENAMIIHDLLMRFARDHKKALVVVTHDPELASLCDTRYSLSDGRLRSC